MKKHACHCVSEHFPNVGMHGAGGGERTMTTENNNVIPLRNYDSPGCCSVCGVPEAEGGHASCYLYQIEASWFDCTARFREFAALPRAEQERIRGEILKLHAEQGSDHDRYGLGVVADVRALPVELITGFDGREFVRFLGAV